MAGRPRATLGNSASTALEERSLRRDQVLDETIRIIGENGFYGFTIQDLGTRCGLSNAGILYYFKSKDLLLIAVLEEVERRETKAIAPHLERALHLPAKSSSTVIELVSAITQARLVEPEVMRLDLVLRVEALNPAHPAHLKFSERDQQFTRLLEKIIAAFADRPSETARMISAVMDGLGEHWLRSDQSFDLVKECRRAVELVLTKADPQRTTPTTRKRITPKRRAKR